MRRLYNHFSVARQPHAEDPLSPVVDGPAAWSTARWSFLALALTFGVAYSFGAFVGPMAADMNASPDQMGWVFGISTFLFLILGVGTGQLCDRHGPQRLVAVGGLLIAAGLVLSACVDDVRLLYLTYGVFVGVGVACIYIPVISNAGCWFDKHRSKALGLTVTGVGIGTLIGAPAAALAVQAFGWRPVSTALGGMVGLLLLLISPYLKRAPQHGVQRPNWDVLKQVATHRQFVLIYLSGIGIGFTLYMPIVFLGPFAVGLGVPPVEAATLVGAIGVASAVSRLLFGGLGDRFGPMRAYQLSTALVMAAYLVWVFGNSYSALLCCALVLGIGYGGITASTPALLMSLFGRDRIGTVIGAMTSSSSFGSLVGCPLAGILIQRQGFEVTVGVFALIAACGMAAVVSLQRTPPTTA